MKASTTGNAALLIRLIPTVSQRGTQNTLPVPLTLAVIRATALIWAYSNNDVTKREKADAEFDHIHVRHKESVWAHILHVVFGAVKHDRQLFSFSSSSKVSSPLLV